MALNISVSMYLLPAQSQPPDWRFKMAAWDTPRKMARMEKSDCCYHWLWIRDKQLDSYLYLRGLPTTVLRLHALARSRQLQMGRRMSAWRFAFERFMKQGKQNNICTSVPPSSLMELSLWGSFDHGQKHRCIRRWRSGNERHKTTELRRSVALRTLAAVLVYP